MVQIERVPGIKYNFTSIIYLQSNHIQSTVTSGMLVITCHLSDKAAGC